MTHPQPAPLRAAYGAAKPEVSKLGLAVLGLGTFAVGSLAAVGLMYVGTLLSKDDAVQAYAPLQITAESPEVTRSASPELNALPSVEIADTPAQPELAVVAPAAVPEPTPAIAPIPSVDPAIVKQEQIANAILIANRNKMRMLTEGVVAGLYDVTFEDAETGTRIGLSPRNAPSAAAELENILKIAAQQGAIEVPQQLAFADGQMDTQTLLFDLVQQALASGTEKEAAAAEVMSQRAFAASPAQTDVVQGQRYYTVERGDSLAYLALQFYGSTRKYNQIFEANRDILNSPDKIKIGQRLLIPNLS